MRAIVFTLLLLPACTLERTNPSCVFLCSTVIIHEPAASAPKEHK